MTTVFIVINALITITALVLCIRAWRGLSAVSKPKPSTVDKPSELARRREELEIVGKAWLYSMEHGLPLSARHERGMMNRLEREVAALENELFGTKEEAISKLKATRSKPILSVEYVDGEIYYSSECATCEWSAASTSKEVAVKIYVEHERKHA